MKKTISTPLRVDLFNGGNLAEVAGNFRKSFLLRLFRESRVHISEFVHLVLPGKLQQLQRLVTKENLMRAFAGESQARNRYTFAANVCCTNKLQVLEAIFLYTAGQEKEHAEIFYNHLVY